MKTLVTGATGFIGRHVCRHLTRQGLHVRVLVRPSTPARRMERLGEVEVVTGDVTVPRTLNGALDEIDAVVHLAGVTAAARASTYRRVNAEGTRALVRACAASGVGRIVFLSSLAAQGPSSPGRPHIDPGSESPVNAYGRSKLEAERHLLDASSAVSATALRPGIVYGPYDPELAAWAWLAQRRLLPVIEGVELSFLHVDDLCRLVARLVTSAAPFGPYFVGEGEPRPMADIADRFERALGRGWAVRLPLSARALALAAPSIERASALVGAGSLAARTLRELSGGGWACRADRLVTDIGFTPEIPFDVGLPRTIEWYRRHRWI